MLWASITFPHFSYFSHVLQLMMKKVGKAFCMRGKNEFKVLLLAGSLTMRWKLLLLVICLLSASSHVKRQLNKEKLIFKFLSRCLFKNTTQADPKITICCILIEISNFGSKTTMVGDETILNGIVIQFAMFWRHLNVGG